MPMRIALRPRSGHYLLPLYQSDVTAQAIFCGSVFIECDRWGRNANERHNWARCTSHDHGRSGCGGPRTSRSAVYEGVKRDQIPSLRLGRRILIPVARLLDWLGVKKDTTVLVPDDPPELTPKAARVLLRVLFEAAMTEDDL